jgi:hypothetical protein
MGRQGGRSANFHADVFELERVGREDVEIGSAIYLSDGVVNLALPNFKGARGHDLEDPQGAVGANPFGFRVEGLAETQRRIEAAGDAFFFGLGDDRKGDFERKFKDPAGVVFDVSEDGWLARTAAGSP